MSKYHYSLTFSSPVSAGDRVERGFRRAAHLVIPGGTIRGALATLWFSAPPPHGDFATLFDDQLIVGQAVPNGATLLSAASLTCKYRTKLDCADVHLDAAAYCACNMPLPYTVCWVCGGPLEGARGWSNAGRTFQRVRSELGEDETAVDERLFRRDMVKIPQFSGTLWLPDDEIDWLQDKTIWVGGGRSLNYGRCVVNVHKADEPGDIPPQTTVGMRCVSPTILLDEYGGPRHDVTAVEQALRQASSCAGLKVTGRREWLRTITITGWHMRSSLPKATDWALDAGSCWLVSGLTADAWRAMQGGIGHRTAEGFGQLELLPPPAAAPDNVGKSSAVAFMREIKNSPRMRAEARSAIARIIRAEGDNLDALVLAAEQGSEARRLLGAGKRLYAALLRLPLAFLPAAQEALK